jgi:hypothetical protein
MQFAENFNHLLRISFNARQNARGDDEASKGYLVMRRLARAVIAMLTDRRANIAIITGLALPAIVGFCGLGAESAYWYFRQRDMQGAADVAAYNGAIALRSASTNDVIKTGATSDATKAGWVSSAGTITVNTPPTTGTHKTDHAVEVILTENEQRYFTGLFKTGTVPIRTRSVAVYNDLGNACLLGLDKTKASTVQFWGNTTSTFTGCNVYSDSMSSTGFAVGGSASATMPCALSVGGFNVDSGLHLSSCGSTTANASYVPDPYRNLAAPTIPASCTNGNNSSMSPGKYCNGLTLNGSTTMAAGVYVISGGTLKINANAVISGTGVTIYLTGGANIQMNGGAQVSLSAPTSGTYSGILLYADRTQANAVNKINGTATSSMTGAIYMPSQEVDIQGNFSGANGCMQVVADTINYTGNSTFATDCSAYGMSNVKAPGQVVLVE